MAGTSRKNYTAVTQPQAPEKYSLAEAISSEIATRKANQKRNAFENVNRTWLFCHASVSESTVRSTHDSFAKVGYRHSARNMR